MSDKRYGYGELPKPLPAPAPSKPPKGKEMRYTIEIQLKVWDPWGHERTLKSVVILDVSDIPELIDARQYAEKTFDAMTTVHALATKAFSGLDDPNR